MMRTLENLILAMQALRANLMRSLLTTLGIIVGVASVITVVAIMQGFGDSISRQFENMGSNTLLVEPWLPFKEQIKGRRAELKISDYEAIARNVDGLEMVIPMVFRGGVRINYEGEQATLQYMLGTIEGYEEINNFYPEDGRFIVPSDDQSRRRVIVLGADVREELDIPENPTGEYVRLNSQWYKVIGEMEKRDGMLGFSQDNMVIVPFETIVHILGRQRAQQFLQLTIKVEDVTQTARIVDQITVILRKRHKIKDGEIDDFRVRTSDQMQEEFEKILNTSILVVAAVVGISLLVGGIGIMNIMLVSVSERTSQIGICKALGATRGDILTQFLAEAIILCLLGGGIGIALGYGIAALASAMIPSLPGAIVPMWAIGLSLGFSSFVGVVFGIVPASKAANLDPIDALQRD